MKVGDHPARSSPTQADEAARRPPAGPRSSASTGSSASTTSGPWASPDRPALSSGPLLGALAASTSTIAVGTAGGPDRPARPTRCWWPCCPASRPSATAGSSPGSAPATTCSRAENVAYGIPFEPADERRARLAVGGRGRARAGGSPCGSAAACPRRSSWPGRWRCCGQPVGGRAAAGGRAHRGRPGGHLGRTGRGHRRGGPCRGLQRSWPRPGPPGPSAPGPTRSRWWPRRPRRSAALDGRPGSGRPRRCPERTVPGWPPAALTSADGVPPDQRPARRTSSPPSTSCRPPARREGRDVIDLGFGNPDLPSPDVAVEKLAEAGPQPAQPPLFGQPGHPEDPPGHLRPLPAQVRGRARPRHRGGHHHRRQGGPLPPDVGAGRARATPPSCPSPSYPIHIYAPLFAGADVRHVRLDAPGAPRPAAARARRSSAT